MRVSSNFILCVNEKLTFTISDWSVTFSSITSAKYAVIFDVFKKVAVLQTFTQSVFATAFVIKIHDETFIFDNGVPIVQFS